jgi:hypothetical protein
LKSEWLEKFQESLFNLSNNTAIPSTIFISADQDFMDFFAEIIRTEQFNQYSLTSSKFKVISLNTKTLHGAVIFKEDIIRDPFITILSVYINRFVK